MQCAMECVQPFSKGQEKVHCPLLEQPPVDAGRQADFIAASSSSPVSQASLTFVVGASLPMKEPTHSSVNEALTPKRKFSNVWTSGASEAHAAYDGASWQNSSTSNFLVFFEALQILLPQGPVPRAAVSVFFLRFSICCWYVSWLHATQKQCPSCLL